MHINDKFSSPNYSIRQESIKYIILHYTEMPFLAALKKLCDKAEEVSAHYLIKEDGEIFQLVEDRYKAWHAGRSSWRGKGELNESSIGIELDNLGNGEFPPAQMESCITLCTLLCNEHNIHPSNIIGHSDIAPSRKIDPGIFFKWSKLAEEGLGMWHKLDPTGAAGSVLLRFGDKGEAVKELQVRLQKIGYNIEPSVEMDKQTNYVIRAFQAHFCPELILPKGVGFYRDNASLYEWNELSETVLRTLLGS